MSEFKINVGDGLVIHFKGTIFEVEEISKVLEAMKKGADRSYVVIGDGDFKVYFDKSKWEEVKIE
jgi:hypothetical protein